MTREGDLDTWCGPSGVWTQLSFCGIIANGGHIRVTKLDNSVAHSAVVALQKHALVHPPWHPVTLTEDAILLGDPPRDGHSLEWTPCAILPSVVRSRSFEPSALHTKCLTSFFQGS